MTGLDSARSLLRLRLTEARLAAGLTQVQVAAALGRHQSWVSKCETGERRIEAVELGEFGRLYGWRVSQLLGAE